MTLCSGRTIWKEAGGAFVKSANPEIGQSRAGEYASALSSFLSGDGEVALRRAYEIGRAR